MKERKGSISELRIGDTIRDKQTQYPMQIVYLSNCGTVEADFESNEGDPFDFNYKELEVLK